jgi:hydroxymethylbilane synthase
VPTVRLRVATRGSELARWQTDHVIGLLRAASVAAGDVDIDVETVVVETAADRRQDTEIWEMGGKGVFVKEVQAAVLDGRADFAVHSAKDLPSERHPGLVLAAVPERADPRDLLVGATLSTLPPGARVATGSVRRRAQLAWVRPDLTFTGLRGNIATRLTRIPDGGAIVMALAAVERLDIDLSTIPHEVLSSATMLPQVGQGALAVECRREDTTTLGMLAAIEHVASRRTVDAERGFLSELGGDCDLPAAAHATVEFSGGLSVEGLLASLDGHIVLRHIERDADADADATGRAVAHHLLTAAGGAALLGR